MALVPNNYDLNSLVPPCHEGCDGAANHSNTKSSGCQLKVECGEWLSEYDRV